MNIAVIGPGAMGLLFGSYLSKRNNVTLIGHNEEKMNNIVQNGVCVQEPGGEEKIYYPKAAADSSKIMPVDLVILFVKSGSSEEALNNNRSIIGENTILMTLQNGAGHEELLCRYADRSNVIIGTTQQGSYLKDSRTVCHSGGGSTSFGTVEGDSLKFETIAKEFQECGFPCEVTNDIWQMIWNKLMINASSSVLSGLLQVRQGYIVENEYAWSIAKKLISEICAVAAADGFKFNTEEQIKRIGEHLRKAPNGYTSIYADLKEGRITEVRKINGTVVDKAHKLNVSVPTHETILALTLAAEQKNNISVK